MKKITVPDVEIYNEIGDAAFGDLSEGESFEELVAKLKDEIGGSEFKIVRN